VTGRVAAQTDAQTFRAGYRASWLRGLLRKLAARITAQGGLIWAAGWQSGSGGWLSCIGWLTALASARSGWLAMQAGCADLLSRLSAHAG